MTELYSSHKKLFVVVVRFFKQKIRRLSCVSRQNMYICPFVITQNSIFECPLKALNKDEKKIVEDFKNKEIFLGGVYNKDGVFFRAFKLPRIKFFPIFILFKD